MTIALPCTDPVQIRIGGFGGQGVVLTGLLLGKAASLYGGKEAVFTQAYGPEARGGASNADVIISDSAVDYPYVTQPDILMVLFQEAYEKFSPLLKPDGVLITEQELVQTHDESRRCFSIPATRLAEQLGHKLYTNVIMLGFLIGLTEVVDSDAVRQAIEDTVKEKALDQDLRAFQIGYDFAQNTCDDQTHTADQSGSQTP